MEYQCHAFSEAKSVVLYTALGKLTNHKVLFDNVSGQKEPVRPKQSNL